MRDRTGIALVTVLLLLTLMFVTCCALQLSVLLDAAQARNSLHQLQASAAAGLALDHALELLQAGTPPEAITVASAAPMGDGLWLMTARGRAGKAESVVHATVLLEDGHPPVVLHRR